MTELHPGLRASEIREYDAFVRRLARRLARDEAGAEDLAQETWLAALQGAPADRGGLRPWLARVVRNRAALRLRSGARRVRRENACARPEAAPDTAELVERTELHRKLVESVLALPDAYREVVLRHYLRGETVAGMTRQLGQPEATVRTRLRRGVAQLRERLSDGFVGGGGAFLPSLTRLAAPEGSGVAVAHVGAREGVLGTTRLTAELIMKKHLLHVPVLVGGLVGAGLGVGGTVLLGDASPARGEGAGAELGTSHAVVLPEEADAASGESVSPYAAGAPTGREALAAGEADGPQAEAPGEAPDPRVLLASPDRLDQVRAIRSLSEEGSPEALELLFQTLLDVNDPILEALLQEALLAADFDLVPLVTESFRSSLEPRQVHRLAGILTELVRRNPALEAHAVGLLVGALRDPGPNGERLREVPEALVDLGVGAVEALAELLSDPLSDPRGVQHAAWVLTHVDPEHAELLRERMGGAVAALIAATEDPAHGAEELRGLVERTQSLAWAVVNRPAAEHDAYSPLLVQKLFDARHHDQAQSLAWGVANLTGLSDGARFAAARTILEHLPSQPDDQLRQSYVWAVSHLAVQQGDFDAGFHTIVQMAQEAMALYRGDGDVSVQLDWLLAVLDERYREAGRR